MLKNFDCRAVETLIAAKLTGCSTWASLRTWAASLVRPAGVNGAMLFSATLEGDAIKDFCRASAGRPG
ncbi:hypothetical protein KCP77_08555 [Salmonella enterica subsp. enterica]|nr:hypothetical protein KCP77_08555 [Salmonella enterica subsp. enterica]